jgi:hypothetical protein
MWRTVRDSSGGPSVSRDGTASRKLPSSSAFAALVIVGTRLRAGLAITCNRTPDHISRRRLAPACPGASHSPRPFLARGVPDSRFPGLRSLAGRSGSSLVPSRRRSWGCTLRRFAPDLGWTREAFLAAERVVETFRFPRDSFIEHLCSSGPTCSLIESVRAPICFRRGVGRPLEYELI